MELSLAETARTLGRSERQVRYMIKARRLKAKKVAGRWVVDSDKLPLSEGQLRARQQKAADLEQTVHDALGPHLKPGGRKVFSVRDVHAFGHAVEACRSARQVLGEGHAASHALEDAVISLTRGSHRFHYREKAEAFREAREGVSGAVGLLYLDGNPASEELALALERDLLPALAGLLRRLERKDGV